MTTSHTVTTGGKGDVFTKSICGLEAQLHSVAHGSLRSSFSKTSTQVKLDPWPHHAGGFHGELVQSQGGAYENGQRGEDCYW